MNKIWFVLIAGSREGPWSFEELKSDRRITPDTLIWREGFEDWRKARDVQELKDLFKDEPAGKESDGNEDNGDKEVIDTVLNVNKPAEGELAMDMQEPPYFLWLLIAITTLLYVFIQLQR